MIDWSHATAFVLGLLLGAWAMSLKKRPRWIDGEDGDIWD